MRWRQYLNPRMMEPKFDAPFPLWLIFPVFFVALYISHLTLLRLPYYWDEAGYYIPAAWDFFRTGSLIPTSTLSNAHPPLPSIYLALWWKASGYSPAVTREAVLLVAAFALLAIWRLVNRIFDPVSSSSGAIAEVSSDGSSSPGWIAFTTVVLTALYPIWFAQSTLAQADIFAAACTLWGLVYSLPDRNRRTPLAAAWFAAAALCKETAILIPLTLAALAAWEALRSKSPSRAQVSESFWLLTPILPLAAWFLFHYSRTGFFFGNPEFLRYNAEANLTPLRFLAALAHRVLHLTAHMNLFVPALLGFAALRLPPRPGPDGRARPTLSRTVLRRIFALLISNAILFSILGGALLCRYLLPMYPLVLLLAVTVIYRRVRFWPALAVLSAAAFIAGIFINPPYGFAPEDNLAYA
ncbi:MAG TPA: glycosyltransferase, partial [Terracidiphilus sp.]